MKEHTLNYKVYINQILIVLSKISYINSRRALINIYDNISCNIWNITIATYETLFMQHGKAINETPLYATHMKHYKATHETSHVQHGHALIET